MPETYFLGIDIGGTSAKWAVVSSNGDVLERDSYKINKTITPEEMAEELIESISNFVDKVSYKLSAVGVACPGAIDSNNGICIYSGNLKWRNLCLSKKLSDKLHLPVKVANDASCAAFGEATFGEGRQYNSFIMVTLGTGIGGGIIIDRKLFLGNGDMGTEIGHMTIEMSNPRKCTCGKVGCFEAYASATALINDAKEAIKKNPDSILAKLCSNNQDDLNGKVIFDAFYQNCPVAKTLIDQYIKYLSVGLLNLCCLFRPNAFLLSGGIANSGDYIIEKTKQILEENNYGFKGYPAVEIKRASLGYDTGIIGAASLAMQMIK